MESTPQCSNATASTLTSSLIRLAGMTHANVDLPTIWSEVSRLLAQQFGHSLFTILTYSPALDRVVRVYSTRPDLHPLGQRHPQSSTGSLDKSESPPPPPPQQQRRAWIQRVLVDGETWRGSTKEDLKGVFEDWELLWSIGLGSVLNIPVRLEGKTVGSLNILDGEHAYDEADLKVGILIAQMLVVCVDKAGQMPTS
ncbi:hypothetical protein RBB50_003157 [Rhinocladiella similis]